MKHIYLDNNATTAIDPRVLDAMREDNGPYNPSSVHFYGQKARQLLGRSRDSIAAYFKVKPHELLFTSGATEALNMILRGLPQSGHVITSNVEHSAIYNTLQQLPGFQVSYLHAGLRGAVQPEAIAAAITPQTRLIILTAANNETGVKIDLEAIAKIAKSHNIPFVVDAVALLGKEEFQIPAGVSAMVFSGHKIHAPKGIGLAFLRDGFKVKPLLTGGDQEFSKRAGTENLSGILGLAKAIEILKEELPASIERMRFLTERLIQGVGSIVINGEAERVCNTVNLSFPGLSGEELLMNLDLAGIAASHGSACSSGALEPSRILIQMGIPHAVARSSIRFSLSRFTTQEEIDYAIKVINELRARMIAL